MSLPISSLRSVPRASVSYLSPRRRQRPPQEGVLDGAPTVDFSPALVHLGRDIDLVGLQGSQPLPESVHLPVHLLRPPGMCGAFLVQEGTRVLHPVSEACGLGSAEGAAKWLGLTEVVGGTAGGSRARRAVAPTSVCGDLRLQLRLELALQLLLPLRVSHFCHRFLAIGPGILKCAGLIARAAEGEKGNRGQEGPLHCKPKRRPPHRQSVDFCGGSVPAALDSDRRAVVRDLRPPGTASRRLDAKGT